MDFYDIINVACYKRENLTQNCVNINCEKNADCPKDSLCQESSREKFCSGKPLTQ